MKLLSRFASMLCLASAPLMMQGAEPLRTEILSPAFRSLKVSNPDDFFAPPVIRLNSDDRLTFSFDEIGDDYSLLEYSLTHCNADWTPSSLIDSEFLPRFNSAKIDDYAFSSNTFVHYVNYRLTIPNDDIAPMLSGNYILSVYPEGEPADIILRARFSVSEDAVRVSGRADGRTDRETNGSLQQVSFAIDNGNTPIRDPFTEVFAVVEQNGDPGSAQNVPHPLSASASQIVYEHLPQLIFPAGNEFRRFETVRTDYPGLHVDSMRYGGSNYHAFLQRDPVRQAYSYDSTQKGRFLVREHNATDSDLGADYVSVHFFLDAPRTDDYDIYVQGEFSNYLLNPEYRLHYDTEARAYTALIPLKQGSYNYRYVAVPRGKTAPTPLNPIEGDFFETLNEYTVKVFYRTPGARADRLLSVSSIIASP